MNDEARKHHDLMRAIDVLERAFDELAATPAPTFSEWAAAMQELPSMQLWAAVNARVLDAARQVVEKR